MTADLESLAAHLRAVERTIPLLEAIRSVAEISYRRAGHAAAPIEEYATRLESFLADFAAATDGSGESAFPEELMPAGPAAVLVISSERGLCGSFNSRLATATLDLVRQAASNGEAMHILCWGSRARRLIEAAGQQVLFGSEVTSAVLPAYETVEAMALELLDLQERNGLSRILVLHNAPAGRFQFTTTIRQLLPPQLKASPRRRSRVELKPRSDAPAMRAHLLAELVLIELYGAAVKSVISEQLARIATMRLAVDNARKLADGLRFEHHLARQRQITDSLLQVVNGYRASTETERQGA